MIHDYGTIVPLCDVRGCVEAQTGEVIELPIESDLWVRVRPCRVHARYLIHDYHESDVGP